MTPTRREDAREVEEMLLAAKSAHNELERIVDAAMIYIFSKMGAQSVMAYKELERLCVRYDDKTKEQCEADYEFAPGEKEWALFAAGIDAKESWEKVKNLIAEAKANEQR